MKTFRFDGIWLLSVRDRRARAVTFSKSNLIVGKNHTGKSSLIKSLFLTLGAKPAGDLADWDRNTISVVRFSFGRESYYAVHQHGLRALYSEDRTLRNATASHSNWWTALADILGFNLVLPNKAQESSLADAACFFLPFYVDQDGSWQASWNTFPSLKQFKAPALPTLEYFTGIKPPDWYTLNAEKNVSQVALNSLKNELGVLTSIRDRFANTMPSYGPKIDPAIFEQELDRLTAEVTKLNAAQEAVREIEVRERESLKSAELQVELAQATLDTYDRDAGFLQTSTHRYLVCPTCGAEHDKSFLSLLGYAEDARVLRELVVRLRGDVDKAKAAHGKSHRKLLDLEDRYRRVSGILSTRRGDLKFDDVVSGMGAERAFGAFEAELKTLEARIDAKLAEVDRLSARLAELTDAKRRKAILTSFRTAYSASTISLNLPPISKNATLAGRPNVSGSGGPRSILAYYSALWHVAFSENGSFSVPLVIDAPQQQGQDEENLPRIIKHIAGSLPPGAQVLLGTERHTDERFDQVIELADPYRLLQEDAFDRVSDFVTPFVEAMYSALAGSDRG